MAYMHVENHPVRQREFDSIFSMNDSLSSSYVSLNRIQILPQSQPCKCAALFEISV